MFPICTFDLIDDAQANSALVRWGHFLEGCNRPFGRQSFGIHIHNELLCVAVSASTVSGSCGGFRRQQLVELARLCAHPEHRDLTRVGLRLWRKIAPDCWGRTYWPVVACVSYSDNTRHKGDIYRFDGWKKVKEVRGGKTGPNSRTANKQYNPKTLWMFETRREAKLSTE